MKKLFLLVALSYLLVIIAIPFLANAQTIVPQTCSIGEPKECCNPTHGSPCLDDPSCPCGINSFFDMLINIYDFIVKDIATPLAIIALIIGGALMMLSGGNPSLMGKGKTILFAAIIGLVLVFASWVIIDSILKIIGYTGNWSIL